MKLKRISLKMFSIACLGLIAFSCIACCEAVAAPAHTIINKTQSKARKITAIRLWNNFPGEKILLRSDGTAICFGSDLKDNPGVGEYRGTFPLDEFQRLAETFSTNGFFELKEQYPTHYVDGTALYSITVVTDNQPEKLMLVGMGRVPAVLSRLKSAIHQAASRVAWHEGPSGVRGVLIMQNAEPPPENSTVEVQSLNNLFGPSSITFPVDKQGCFEMPLPPGSYQLTPGLTIPTKLGYALFWDSSTVIVLPNQFTSLKILCTPHLMPLTSYRGG